MDNIEHHDINDLYHRLVDIKNELKNISALMENFARTQERQTSIFRPMLEFLQSIDAKTPPRSLITADKATIRVTQKGS